MIRIIRFLDGYVHVQLTGYAPERFLNLCRSRHILLWDLQPSGQGYGFYISIRSFRRLKPLLRKTGTKVHITEKRGLFPLAFRYRKHKFFLVGIAAACGILISFSGFIWDVEINGNSRFSDQTLLGYLEEQGAGYGSLKNRLDCEKLESDIRKDYPDIIWVSVKIQGTRLIVDVQEAAGAKEDGDAQTKGTDLIADYDGTVESIVTRSGTPCVKKGDMVKKGDILVSGCLELFDDFGSVTGYEYCHADADVLISLDLPYEDVFPAKDTRYKATGRTRRRIGLDAGSWRMSIGLRRNKFEVYDQITSLDQVRFGKNFYLPLELEMTRIRELVPYEHTYSEEEIQALAGERLELYCRKLEEKNFEIKGKNVKINAGEKEISVKGNLEALEKAEKTGNTEIRTLKKEEGQEENGIDTGNNGNSS